MAASLVRKKGKAKTTIANLRRHVQEHLDLGYTKDLAERERVYRRMVAEGEQLRGLEPRHHALVQDEPGLLDKIAEARRRHEQMEAARD